MAKQADPGTAILITSDHGLGPAQPIDPLRSTQPGRPHPMGLFVLSGPHLQVGRSGDVLRPFNVAPLLLYLLGQPLPRNIPPHVNERILQTRYYEMRPAVFVPTYQDKNNNPPPSHQFGRSIGAQERYTRFNEPAPPKAR